jgi:hypothetical protein
MATTATVTVNGMSVKQYLGQEKSNEIQNFLRDELRSMRHSTGRHITSGGPKNVSKPKDVGNGSLRIEVR